MINCEANYKQKRNKENLGISEIFLFGIQTLFNQLLLTPQHHNYWHCWILPFSLDEETVIKLENWLRNSLTTKKKLLIANLFPFEMCSLSWNTSFILHWIAVISIITGLVLTLHLSCLCRQNWNNLGSEISICRVKTSHHRYYLFSSNVNVIIK